MKPIHSIITLSVGLSSIITSLIVNHIMLTVLFGVVGGFLITLPIFIYVIEKELK